MQKFYKIFLSLSLLFLFLNKEAFSTAIDGNINALPVKKDTSLKSAKISDSAEQKITFNPSVRIGIGMLSYIGGVKVNGGTTNIQNPSSGRPGYDIGLSQKLLPAVESSLNFLYGSVGGNERTTTAYWNFQSKVVGGGISFLFKLLPKQDVTPYAIIGAEWYSFNSSADIYDQNGNQYYAWTDGSLRSIPQNSPDAANAKTLSLTYAYSTNVQTLNGSSGSSTQQTFAVPVGIGFMFRIATRADFMIGTTLHYTFTNHMDGLTSQTQGIFSNDMFLFSYISLRFSLIGGHSEKAPEMTNVAAVNAPLMKDTTHRFKPTHIDSAAEHQPIATNSENTTYTIQLIATKNKLDEGLSFAGIHNKANVVKEDGMYVYTTGTFTDINDARKYLQEVRGMGYTDAFIRTTKSSQKIAVPEDEVVVKKPANIPTNDTNKMPVVTANTNDMQETKKGLVFKLQWGVFNSAPNQKFTTMFNKLKDISVVKDAAGLSHYLSGSYTNYQTVEAACNKARAEGANDVCIKALYEGHFISIGEAMHLLKK